MKAQHKKSMRLVWPNLWEDLNMAKDGGGRWDVTESTPEKIRGYLRGYRAPSRAFPNSRASAALTIKFSKWLSDELPELAIKCGVAEEVKI